MCDGKPSALSNRDVSLGVNGQPPSNLLSVPLISFSFQWLTSYRICLISSSSSAVKLWLQPVNKHDLEEKDEEKAQQWEQCSQVHTQQENNLQINTFPHQPITKEERHEDHEVPIILGQPYLSIASCVLDIGKGKLELSVEDQKISFDLFEAMKHPDDSEACFEEEMLEQEIELTASTMVL